MATTPVSLSQTPTLRRPTLPLVGGMDTSRFALLTVLAVLMLGAASLVYLNLAAAVANSSSRLQDITKMRRELEWQRAARAQDLAQVTAPDRLEARAQELGFRPATSVTYVTISPNVAAALDLKPHPAVAVPTLEAPPTGWNTVQAQFERWLGKQ